MLSPPTHPPAGFSCFKDSRSSCITLSQTNEETEKLRAVRKLQCGPCKIKKVKLQREVGSLVAQIQKEKKKVNTERCNILKGKKAASQFWWCWGMTAWGSYFREQHIPAFFLPADACPSSKNTLSVIEVQVHSGS